VPSFASAACDCYLEQVTAFALAFAGLLALPLLLVSGILAWLSVNHLRFTRWHRRAGLAVPITGAALLGYLAGELGCVLRILSWRLRWRVSRPRLGGAGRPVVCLHGFAGAPGDMFGLVRALAEHGRPAYSIGMGPPFAPIERWAAELADRLRAVLDEHDTADGVDLVAHSMGGLLVRVLLEKYPEVGARVRTLVTLGTPHEGTAVVEGFAPGQNTTQMRRGSAFLQGLARPTEAAPSVRVVTFGGVQDYIVYPADTCRLEGAPHIKLDAGHTGLVASSRSIDRVIQALSESEEQR